MSNTSMPANFLNKTPLPSITGLAAKRADVAQAQHSCAVGDDRHQVAPAGVFVSVVRVFDDFFARRGDAWRVGQRQIMLVHAAAWWLESRLCRGWGTRGIPVLRGATVLGLLCWCGQWAIASGGPCENSKGRQKQGVWQAELILGV
jgi:hypothetical protein